MLKIADNKPFVLQRCLQNVVRLVDEGIFKPQNGKSVFAFILQLIDGKACEVELTAATVSPQIGKGIIVQSSPLKFCHDRHSHIVKNVYNIYKERHSTKAFLYFDIEVNLLKCYNPDE